MAQKKVKRSFLLLELLIALFLVALCALPLVRLPMHALRQESESAWRIGIQRYADLAYAKLREDLHTRQIDWETLSSTREKKSVVIDDEITLALKPIGKRTFIRKGVVWSVGKTNKGDEECRLVTFQVRFQTRDKFKLFRFRSKKRDFSVYNYKFVALKTPKKNKIEGHPSAPLSNSS